MAEIRLTKGRRALVDDCDFALVDAYSWQALKRTAKRYYAKAADRNGKSVLMHRLIVGAARGQFVDHANGDGLDNRRANLRLCSNSQNQGNRRPQKRKRSSFNSKFKGVSKYPNLLNPWCARLRGKWVGAFATELEAARAYDAAALAVFGEFALLNNA